MPDVIVYILLCLYFLSAGMLGLYGINAYLMVWLFGRARKNKSCFNEPEPELFLCDSKFTEDLPVITTQIPVYNEYNVTESIILCCAAMQYPHGKHEIQILDDSTDETSMLIDNLCAELQGRGVDIKAIRRENREGYKAGALANGLTRAHGEIIAIFDADFQPPVDFLMRSVPYFMSNKKCGLVQCRWGHINRQHSLLTRAQAIGIDGHFVIEQFARSRNGLFMNFNGTAGLWRRDAISDAGGWGWDTLTEDMDLSYRMQLAGWSAIFLPEIVAPAEIPQSVSAFRSQQFRWAKGSIQTAIKLMPKVIRADCSLFTKIQAFMHMTHYAVHPLMLLQAILALPILLMLKLSIAPAVFAILAPLLLGAMCAPNTLYIVSQRYLGGNWMRRIMLLPMLTCLGTGLAVSNTRAVIEAILGKDSPFIRTPKSGNLQNPQHAMTKSLKKYSIKAPIMPILEITLGLYCAGSFIVYINSGRWLVGPFLAIYTIGFLYMGGLDILQGVKTGAK